MLKSNISFLCVKISPLYFFPAWVDNVNCVNSFMLCVNFKGNGNEGFKVDLNVEADPPAEDEDDDDIDWEEG